MEDQQIILLNIEIPQPLIVKFPDEGGFDDNKYIRETATQLFSYTDFNQVKDVKAQANKSISRARIMLNALKGEGLC